MEENNVIALRQPSDIADPLTEAPRNGVRALLAQAVEAEVAEALAALATETPPPDPGHPRHQDSGIAPSMKCGSCSAMSSNPSKAAGKTVNSLIPICPSAGEHSTI